MDFKIEMIDGNKLYRGAIPFFLKDKKRVIYISSSNRNIENYYYVTADMGRETLKVEKENESGDENRGKKYRVSELVKSDFEFTIFMTFSSFIDEYNRDLNLINLKKGERYSIKELIGKIESAGYVKNYLIEKRGEYSKRGDILDIFLIDKDSPIRVEFFDDLIEEIRYFDIDTQRSVEKLEEVSLIFDESGGDKSLIIDLIKNRDVEVIVEDIELLRYKLEENIFLKIYEEDIIREKFEKIVDDVNLIETLYFENSELDYYKKNENIKKISKDKKVTIISEESKRYKEIFCEEKIEIEKYPYFEGFKNGENIVLTDRELKGVRVRKREKRKESFKISDIKEIRENDYLIHENYGVGLFLGIVDIKERDYIAIRYADEDKLYVPIEHIDRVEKYLMPPGREPELYKLGRKGFGKRKAKMQENIMEFARELIKVQAKRDDALGYEYSRDTVWQEEFEESFPYTETKDQMKCINDVKDDMESKRVMDRIICGDVGFGKTEVALRAIFKAVMDGKQVALIAPTTVLVNQHYERILERFKNYPIEIDMMSRLVTPKKQREILERMRKGTVDIVIGTHRLVQDDIKFNDIGLIVIDEEQKFGVKAKEKLKKFRNNVDLLTLTATPIPRTLNLSILGIKDISLIETPPENRLSIKTDIIKKDSGVIKEAILKEISRDGQIFYIYNRVKDMKMKLNELEKIVPKYVKMDYIHGKMEATEIKDKIEKFENGDFDLLLTTTIVENGIDIENANTIIIDKVDKLGLSQIYQLRGRVGRGDRQAYCYLMYESSESMTTTGKERLTTLKELSGSGGGLNLSLEDMKIRGAGEILGDRQHGAIEVLGYDLYMKMLKDEIRRIKNEKIVNYDEIDIKIKLKGYIPSSYIEESEKIRVYKRIIMVENLKELKEISYEIEDRFGKLPEEVKNLLRYFRIKILAYEKDVESIEELKEGYKIKFKRNKLEMDGVNMLILNEKLKYLQKDRAVLLKEKSELLVILKKI